MTLATPSQSPRSEVVAAGSVSWWQVVTLAAMAGGLGWGIRGQYGHETGAMMAGLLVSLVLVVLFCPTANAGWAARAVAWGTLAMGIGGSMTYGQTVGLTHDQALVGNGAALGWGMLGLAIKGGVWIGFAGLFLGMGLGGVRYAPRELLLLMLGLLVLFGLGVWLLNHPYDPEHRRLPLLYFSDDWRWEPDAELRPRREVWGGLWCALLGAIVYAGLRRRDRLAWRLALWGVAGGAVGFPLGQSVQAFHAWNADWFQSGGLAEWAPYLNWWNWMETVFGATFGAILGLGLWVHRREIGRSQPLADPSLNLGVEAGLAAVHVGLLAAGTFLDYPAAELYQEYGLALVVLPVVAVAGGRLWPWLVIFPITLIPIAGKTLQRLVYEEAAVAAMPGWLVFLVGPLAVSGLATVWAFRRAAGGCRAQAVLPQALILGTWVYFGLNYAFFRFPWPWAEWTARTPNSLAFAVCALGLTAGAVLALRGGVGSADMDPGAGTARNDPLIRS